MGVPRHIELWLHGLELDPTTLVPPRPDLRIMPFRKGSELRTGRSRDTNCLIVEHHFGFLTSWEDALDSLVASLGGEMELARLLERVGAKRQHVGFDLPIRSSPYQEGNALSLRSLELLCRLRLDLQFGFWEFDENDPTHRDPTDGEWAPRGEAGT